MGAYSALAIRPPEDPMSVLIKAQQIKAGFLGQQLLAQEIQQRGLQAQREQMLVQGQQQLVAVQPDPDWDASDLTNVDKIFDKYNVPDVAQTQWYHSRKDFNDLVFNTNKQYQSTLQEAYDRFHDGPTGGQERAAGSGTATFHSGRRRCHRESKGQSLTRLPMRPRAITPAIWTESTPFCGRRKIYSRSI